MPTSLLDVGREIDDELRRIQESIDRIRAANRRGTQQVQMLTQKRTEAFVDLATHYLPELTQQTWSDAWTEVKRDIGDVLLRKRDDRRRLRSELAASRERQRELETQRVEAQQELDQSKLVLSCKTGNFKKLLRDDPLVQKWIDEIAVLDEEIECYLVQHESIQADARRKLPAYEQSSLFEYLKEQGFGTPEYLGRGVQRRWDRWVATLIGYGSAKKSYDFLVSTPEHLKKLIDEKQSRYRSLLVQLKQARHQAALRHGTQSQKREWERCRQKVAEIDEQIEEAKWESVVLLGRIDELEDPSGSHYTEALDIYQRFLGQVQPDAMRIYAECTDSPVDDEICARLRNVQSKIADEQTASKDRFIEMVLLEKKAATLRELALRLRRFERESPGEVTFGDDFRVDKFLRDIRQRQTSPDDAWQEMCDSLLLPNHVSPDENHDAQTQMLPTEASFAASSEFLNSTSSDPASSSLLTDAANMVLLAAPASNDAQAKGAFSTLAIFRCRQQAKQVAKLLKSKSIACFVHTHTMVDDTEEVDIVVSNEDYTDAAKLIRNQQGSVGQPWTCGECRRRVGKGWGRCWHCGQKKPAS